MIIDRKLIKLLKLLLKKSTEDLFVWLEQAAIHLHNRIVERMLKLRLKVLELTSCRFP